MRRGSWTGAQGARSSLAGGNASAQGAHDLLGRVDLYSSAAFAFAPDISLAFHRALKKDDRQLVDTLLRTFFHPLVRLRERVPGYAVSIVKAGVPLEGVRAGPVRPPLTPLTSEERTELATIIAEGRRALAAAG